jgi:RecA-family ATPase
LCAARPDLAIDAPVIISDIKRQLGEKLPACIVLDTLNRTLVGSENKPEDMSRYLRSAGMIQDAFKCLVVVVHHTGVEQGRPRGHTSLTAAASHNPQRSRPRRCDGRARQGRAVRRDIHLQARGGRSRL